MNRICLNYLTLAILAMSLASGCAQPEANDQPKTTQAAVKSIKPQRPFKELHFSTIDPVEGEIGYAWHSAQGTEFRLITSESQGLLLVNQGKVQSSLRNSVELLDIRTDINLDNSKQAMGISYDQNRGELFLFSVATAPTSAVLKEVTTLPIKHLEIENVCLQKSRQGHLYAFILDGKGNVRHYLLVDGQQSKLALQSIREFNVAPGSTACAVDDNADRLYVLEEDLGIWSYAASAEADPDRTPFQLITPYGLQLASASGIAIANGMLATIESEQQILKLFALNSGDLLQEISLNGIENAESVSISATHGKGPANITVYSAASDSYYNGQVTLATVNREIPEAITEVFASVETTAMNRFGDVADDPAIWVNPKDPSNSRILGTNKKSGLHVYDLAGKELQSFATGRLNNVDLRHDIRVADDLVTVAAASNRSDNSIALYTIDSNGVVKAYGGIATGLAEVYGLCNYRDQDGNLYVFVNDKDGRFQQWHVRYDAQEKGFSGNLVRRFITHSQPEGCVVNDKTQRIFVGEEDAGVWVTSAKPDGGDTLQPVIKVNELDPESPLIADVEGLAIYQASRQDYLIISSQGNDSYLVLDALPPYQYRGRFRIGMNIEAGIDGASETDGLDVVSAALPGPFAEGMLVVQDGRNVLPQEGQNFKYISWRQIREALMLEP